MSSKLVVVNLLLFLPIWRRKLVITIKTYQSQFTSKLCIISKRWTASQVHQDMGRVAATTSPQTGQKNSTHHQEVNNTMAEAPSSFHGTIIMVHFQRSWEKATIIRRCISLSTLMKLPQVVTLLSKQVSGSGWLHKVQNQACTTSSQAFGSQIVQTELLEWKQATTV